MVVLGDVVDVAEGDLRLAQAVVDGVERQLVSGEWNRALAVLDPREALFLRCRDHLPIADQAGGRVVVDRVDAERVHAGALDHFSGWAAPAAGTPPAVTLQLSCQAGPGPPGTPCARVRGRASGGCRARRRHPPARRAHAVR